MYIKKCDMCGEEFKARFDTCLICNSCKVDMFKSMNERAERQITHINQRLVDQVREATKRGMTYGQFKGRYGNGFKD